MFNSSLGINGTVAYSEANDVLRVRVPAGPADAVHEAFVIEFEEADSHANMVLTWDRTRVAVAIAAF